MSDSSSDNYVFAAVPYANAVPLAHFLTKVHAGVRVTYAPPAELAEGLLSGEADAAMLPVADYFDVPGLKMIDGLGICADGEVQSVLLKCRRPIREVRIVGMDAASRTSNALARILLEDHFGLSVRMKHCSPGEPADAAVAIGDRALCDPPAPCGDYDLAGLWKEMTGLPFVFAVWAYREDHPNPRELSRIAHAAKDAGVAALRELAEVCAARLPLSVQRCYAYLTSAVHHDLGPRESEAMRLFRELLNKRDRLPAGPPGGGQGGAGG
ncbi:MAG: menaquinone biosynthesis protein [Phycisphaerae bacterium]